MIKLLNFKAERGHNLKKFFQECKDAELQQACYVFSENPLICDIFQSNKLKAKDIKKICREYLNNPRLYDDIFKGKVKYIIPGGNNKPIPVFDPKTNENIDLKKLFGKNKMIRLISEIVTNAENKVKLFDFGNVYIEFRHGNETLYLDYFTPKYQILETEETLLNTSKIINTSPAYKLLEQNQTQKFELIRHER